MFTLNIVRETKKISPLEPEATTFLLAEKKTQVVRNCMLGTIANYPKLISSFPFGWKHVPV